MEGARSALRDDQRVLGGDVLVVLLEEVVLQRLRSERAVDQAGQRCADEGRDPEAARLPKRPASEKIAAAVERAGFSDAFVTGMATRIRTARARPIASGAETFVRAAVRRTQDDADEQRRHDDLDEQRGDEREADLALATRRAERRVRAEAVGDAGRTTCWLASAPPGRDRPGSVSGIVMKSTAAAAVPPMSWASQ